MLSFMGLSYQRMESSGRECGINNNLFHRFGEIIQFLSVVLKRHSFKGFLPKSEESFKMVSLNIIGK